MAYRAYELCILLTNSKLLIASPRKAGVKGMVNSLKDRRFSPRSISGILLTIFSSATLAQALLAVYIDIFIISNERFSWSIGDWLDLRTTVHQGKSLLAFHRYPHASGREKSSRKQEYCPWSVITPIYKSTGGSEQHTWETPSFLHREKRLLGSLRPWHQTHVAWH